METEFRVLFPHQLSTPLLEQIVREGWVVNDPRVREQLITLSRPLIVPAGEPDDDPATIAVD